MQKTAYCSHKTLSSHPLHGDWGHRGGLSLDDVRKCKAGQGFWGFRGLLPKGLCFIVAKAAC